MTTKIFKTRKLAEKYKNEFYSDNSTERRTIDNRAQWEAIDIPNFEWQGEISAIAILDESDNEIECLAWWEEGDDKYELFVGDKLAATFDNHFDAREAYNGAVEAEECKDEEADDVFEVKLMCNGEDISK